MKNPSTPLINESFWKYIHFWWVFYFAMILQLYGIPNYIVGGYVKYIWYVKKYSSLIACSYHVQLQLHHSSQFQVWRLKF
jgi:hypothetical protein